MRIEYLLEDGEGNHISHFVNIDISEESSIQEVITKLHQAINLPLYKELKYEGEIVKVYYSHFVKSGIEDFDYQWLDDGDKNKKLLEFPKCGVEGEFCIYIEEGAGLVN